MKRLIYPPVYIGLFTAQAASMLAMAYARNGMGNVVLYMYTWLPIYVLTLLGGWFYAHGRLPGLARVSNTFALLTVVLLGLQFVFGSAVAALVFFLLGIQAARNLTLSTRRDLYFAALIGFMLILYSISRDADSTLFVFLAAYTVAMVFTFMAEHVDSRLGYAVGGDRDALIRSMRIPANVAVVAFLIVGIALLIYLLLPRLPSPKLELFPNSGGSFYSGRGVGAMGSKQSTQDGGRGGQSAGQGQSGTKSLQELASSSATASSREEILFTVETDRGLYAKEVTYGVYDGLHWEPLPPGEIRRPLERNLFDFTGRADISLVEQLYTIKQPLTDSIPVAFRVSALYFPANEIVHWKNGDLRAPSQLLPYTYYAAKSTIGYFEGRPVSGINDLEDSPAIYLKFPDVVSDRVRELADRLTANKINDYDRAVAVEQYLRKNYRYRHGQSKTDGKSEPVAEMLDQFLFQLKSGHAGHFASSMTLLLRSVGVPARVVTGYSATRYSPMLRNYVVIGSDQHAWVEVHIPEYGWTMFEPTPTFVLPDPRRFDSLIERLTERLRAVVRDHEAQSESGWRLILLQTLLGFLDVLREWFSQAIEFLVNAFEDIVNFLWSYKEMALVSIGVLAIGITVIYQMLGFRMLGDIWDDFRLWWIRNSDDRRQILQSYLCAERKFSRRGYRRHSAWTHRDYEQLLAAHFPRLRSELGILTDVFGLARYSMDPLSPVQVQMALRSHRAIGEYLSRNEAPAASWTNSSGPALPAGH